MASTSETVGAPALLEMRGVTKRFPGVLANDNIDFDVKAGEVHTLFGENGAGKSTLMRVLYGFYQPDAGQVYLEGEPVEISSPAAAIGLGIGMIHQHFMLVPTLTVAENVSLGLRSTRGPLKDMRGVSARIDELSSEYGLEVNPSAYVWQLSVGERQRVEIMKALYRQSRLLVLDEPTAVLTPREVDDLFRVLRQMAADGHGLIFISHKIREVFALSDRITVLRAGRRVGTVRPSEITHDQLAEMMVGRHISGEQAPPASTSGEVRLQVRDLVVRGDRGTEAVRGMSFEVRAGEIVGVAGVSGNGQRELGEAIACLRSPLRGSVKVEGDEIAGKKPSSARRAGLGYVPEERMRDGVIGDFSVSENLMLCDSAKPAFVNFGFLRRRSVRAHSKKLVSTFDVRTPGIDTPARNLSGGNIQKLILARELSGAPKVLLVAQPTRGVDIAAARYIHEQLFEQASSGIAVLIISEDLDEVMSVSDRILVMYEGAIIGEASPRSTTREAIGLMMAGIAAGGGPGPGATGSASSNGARASVGPRPLAGPVPVPQPLAQPEEQ
ncbi:MAG TPA: ABC transporter ATP-binding protein [Acidimicrobiales bacterium]|nr:ABC transporter ATP-binding protein [Acidimicrobiales bacterium]